AFRAALGLAAVLAFVYVPTVYAAGGSPIDERNETLHARAKQVKVASFKRLGGKKAATTRVVGQKQESFIFRQPSRGPDKGLRSSRAFQFIPTELGRPAMVPAAAKLKVTTAIGEFAAGEELMVMADEAPRFNGADEAPGAWLDAVPENTRVTA